MDLSYNLPKDDPTNHETTFCRMAERCLPRCQDASFEAGSPICAQRTSRGRFHHMDTYEDPAAARRRLQRELRALRTDANLTQRDVAEEMEWSPSKVIRIESGSVSITTNDLKQLLAYYGIKDQSVIDELLLTNRESRKQSWAEYKDVLPLLGRTYWGYEASAIILRQFELSLVPGLLQTEEYTRALLSEISMPRSSEERVSRLIEARAARQTLLDRPELPELFFIIDESALRREVGGKAVMRRQLDRIEGLAGRDRISIQVVPLSAGAYPGLLGPFILFEFKGDDTALYIESRTDTVTRDDPDEIGLFLDAFQNFEKRIASKPEDLTLILSKIKKDMG
jgi:transcriptional regulator with XRE-family HTH domain